MGVHVHAGRQKSEAPPPYHERGKLLRSLPARRPDRKVREICQLFFFSRKAACAAESRAIGTRKGEQLT